MGKKDDKNAVVDSELKVFGTKNLRVIDGKKYRISFQNLHGFETC